MKIAVFMFLVAMPFVGKTQDRKTKDIKIAHIQTVDVIGVIHYDENTPVDTLYHILARDNQYDYLIEIFGVKSFNSIVEMQNFLTNCLKAFNEDDGVTLTYDGTDLYIHKTLGIKLIDVSGTEKESDSFVSLSKGQVTSLISQVYEFSKKMKVKS